MSEKSKMFEEVKNRITKMEKLKITEKLKKIKILKSLGKAKKSKINKNENVKQSIKLS